MRPCRFCFRKVDARILEEPRKSRKSHGSEGLKNAFSVGKGERKKRREGRKKLRARRIGCRKKRLERAKFLREFSRENQVISRGTSTTHSLSPSLSCSSSVGKNDYPMTTTKGFESRMLRQDRRENSERKTNIDSIPSKCNIDP